MHRQNWPQHLPTPFSIKMSRNRRIKILLAAPRINERPGFHSEIFCISITRRHANNINRHRIFGQAVSSAVCRINAPALIAGDVENPKSWSVLGHGRNTDAPSGIIQIKVRVNSLLEGGGGSKRRPGSEFRILGSCRRRRRRLTRDKGFLIGYGPL